MFCTKCGNEIAVGSAFCSKCGSPVKQSSPPAVSSAAFIGAASNSAPAGAAAKKKPVLPIAIAVIVIAVIGVAIFTGGFGLLGSVSPKDTVEEVNPKDSLEDYTWEELSAISAEIATASSEDKAIELAKTYNLVNEDGTLDGTQTKDVTLTDGTKTSVQIAGFIHDDKSDGSGKAGITFIFADAIAEMSMGSNNTGGWKSSGMRSWLTSDGKALLPEDLQDVLVAVDKSTNNVGMTEDVSSVTTTSDELWLFSWVEITGELDESGFSDGYEYLAAIMSAEGSQYKLFSDCDVNLSYDILEKTYQGGSCEWWMRSPNAENSVLFRLVSSDGYPYGDSTFAPVSNAVVPGFCI